MFRNFLTLTLRSVRLSLRGIAAALMLAGVFSGAAHAEPTAVYGPVTGGCRVDDRFFLTADGVIHILNHDATPVSTISSPSFRVFDVCAGPEPGVVFFCGGIPGRTGVMGSARHHDGNWELSSIEVDDDTLYRCRFDNAGIRLFAAGESGAVHSLKPGRDGLLRNVDSSRFFDHGRPVHAMELAAAKRILVLGGRGGVLNLVPIDGHGGEVLSITDHTGAVACVAVDESSEMIFSGSDDGRVRQHDFDGKLRRTWTGLGRPKTSLEDRMRDSTVMALVVNQKGEADAAAREDPVNGIFLSTSCGAVISLDPMTAAYQLCGETGRYGVHVLFDAAGSILFPSRSVEGTLRLQSLQP
jgi:WD40 repeat protein